MSRTWPPRAAAWLLPVLLVTASGCIRLPAIKATKRPIDFYSLAYEPPEALCSVPRAGVLLLRRLTAYSVYGTDRMVTKGSVFTTEFSYYSRWAASPASMVTDLLYRDICDSGLFDAVLNGPGFLRPEYEISGTLEAMQARRRLGRWHTELTVNILFFPYADDSASPVMDRIFQKRYQITAPCTDSSPEAVAASLSECMRSFSSQLIPDLAAFLQRPVGARPCPSPAATKR